MQQVIRKFSFTALAAVLLLPATLLAQKEEVKEKEEAERIIITRKATKDEKVVIVVDGDKITVNGKEVDKGSKGDKGEKDQEISVTRTRIKDVRAFGGDRYRGGAASMYPSNTYQDLSFDSNRAMLGVTTEKIETGLRIQDITKESGAEKAGLKEGDVIIKIDDKKIDHPDELSEVVKAHKPGDKITVTYLRDKKEQKVTAELGKWKGATTVMGYGQNFDFNTIPDIDFEKIMPRIQTLPRVMAPGQNWNINGFSTTPKLGLSVQDTEDGKGVQVIAVDEESNGAKAGIEEEDIITEVDGKAVNSADEIAKIMKESKDKISVKMKLLRKGKDKTVEVKIPRKLKTADL
jgi:serine protease Do